MPKTPTMDQIRAAIDGGRTGEKVDFPDPAAAPLGTDAEAGGHSATLADRELEARSQPHVEKSHSSVGFALYATVIALIAIAVVGIVIAATS